MPPKNYPEDANAAFIEAMLARRRAIREHEQRKETARRLRRRAMETLARVESLLTEIRFERRAAEIERAWRENGCDYDYDF